MIVKILNSASKEFNGVRYNDKKIENGSGELMLMKNFPSTINEESSQKEVKDYLKSISKSNKVKKPQFHAVISTKFREHSKEELTEIAEKFMQEMGYGEQPYIAVFHNDTENNHIHIVSTRVDKSTGKKIDDSFEKLKSQRALQKVLAQLQGKNLDKDLEKLLRYKFGTMKQLELLLERGGFKLVQNKNDDTAFDILKNGVRQKTLEARQIVFHSKSDSKRAKQIKAFLEKYKEIYSNKVFKVIDSRETEGIKDDKTQRNFAPKIEFESELQHKMREMFGIDIVFHHKDGQKPFGYSLIDHKTQKVYKGSEIMKMNEIFDFTQDKLDKRLFEQLKDFNIYNAEEKKVLLDFLTKKGNFIKDYMLFENKKKVPIEAYREVRHNVKEFIKKPKNDNGNIDIVKGENGKHYIIYSEHHQIWDLQNLVGDKDYAEFLNPKLYQFNGEAINEIVKEMREIGNIILQPSYTAKDPAEYELMKKKKKRKR